MVGGSSEGEAGAHSPLVSSPEAGDLASSQPPVTADPRAKGYVAAKAKEVVEAWAGLAKKQMCTKEEFEKGACGEGLLHLASKYFETWNSHDSAGLEALFSDRVSLVDWEQQIPGRAEVANADVGLFSRSPSAEVEVKRLHVAPATRSVVCEITVRFNSDQQAAVAEVPLQIYLLYWGGLPDLSFLYSVPIRHRKL